jgi:hypothetical protein
MAKWLKMQDPSLRSGHVSGGETSFAPETNYVRCVQGTERNFSKVSIPFQLDQCIVTKIEIVIKTEARK